MVSVTFLIQLTLTLRYEAVAGWLLQSQLKWNPAKTEVLYLNHGEMDREIQLPVLGGAPLTIDTIAEAEEFRCDTGCLSMYGGWGPLSLPDLPSIIFGRFGTSSLSLLPGLGYRNPCKIHFQVRLVQLTLHPWLWSGSCSWCKTQQCACWLWCLCRCTFSQRCANCTGCQ